MNSKDGRYNKSETRKSRWIEFIRRHFFIILAIMILICVALLYFIYRDDSEMVSDDISGKSNEEIIGEQVADEQIADEQIALGGPEPNIEPEDSDELAIIHEVDGVYIDPNKSLVDIILEWVQDADYDIDDLSFSIEDMESGAKYEHNAREYHLAASTYKLPLAMLWMDKVKDGEIVLDDTLPYLSYMYEDGGPIDWNYAFGSNIDLKTIIEYTIQYSDNSGGHILFEALGGWNQFRNDATKYCPVPQDEIYFGDDNYCNAEFMNYVLRRLYDGKDDYWLIMDAMEAGGTNGLAELGCE